MISWRANDVSLSSVAGVITGSSTRPVVSGQVRVGSECVDWRGTDFTFASNETATLGGCDPIVTRGLWSDASQWDGVGDQAVIDVDNTIVVLDVDVALTSLTLAAGTLQLAHSQCDDWFPVSFKVCAKAFNHSVSWEQAPCRLAHVDSDDVNARVADLCAHVADRDCWIGLRSYDYDTPEAQLPHEDSVGFAWFATNDTYRSWARLEPREFADCAVITHRAYDPESAGFATWRARDCRSELPYVCTRRGDTTPFQLNATTFDWTGGSLDGAGTLQAGVSRLSSSRLDMSGGATLLVTSELTAGSHVVGRGGFISTAPGATVYVDGDGLSGFGVLTIVQDSTLRLRASGTVLSWRAELANDATLVVDADASLTGGASLVGDISLSATLTVANKSVAFRSPAVDVLAVTADAPVVREDVTYESSFFVEPPASSRAYYHLVDDTFGAALGVYSLTFNGETTSCLPHHASAFQVETALEALDSVRDLGGVTVTRRGDGSRRWNFGYSYAITYDTAEATSVATLSACVDCCYDALVHRDATPTGTCRHGEAQNTAQGGLCVAKLEAQIGRRGGRDATVTAADSACVLGATSGWHRFSGVLPCELRVDGNSSKVDVASAAASFSGGITIANGALRVSGAGLHGDDTNALIYASFDAYGRASLDPPPFTSTASALTMTGGMLAFGGADGASLDVTGDFDWSGGTIAGPGHLVVSGRVYITGNCELQSSAILEAAFGGTWENSALVVGTGASIWITGTPTLALEDFAILVPQRPQLDVPFERQDAGAGWYANPACRNRCNVNSTMHVASSAFVRVRNGDALIQAPVRLAGRIRVDDGRSLTLDDGADGNGRFDLRDASRLVLRDGTLNLETLFADVFSGDAHLLVRDRGRLYLPEDNTLEPHLVVKGGTAIERGQRLTFEKSVEVSNGSLAFAAVATNATFAAALTLSGANATLQFPVRDTLTHVHRTHVHDQARNEDRSQVDVYGFFNLSQGAVRGNADVYLHADSAFDKATLSDAAFLINRANMLLYGSVVAHTDAYLENRGTVELDDPRHYSGMYARRADDRDRWWPLANNAHHDFEDNQLRDGRRIEVRGSDSVPVLDR